ncbi:MAG TPA: aspartate kinase [Nitrospira sp.]|uniref:aspartate kinase n=1 Tax=Nitrospira sp. ND1 TaxID=1658518 RepID=UPI0009BC566C|nr:aspartate kinase [Nitrospira sp. ND1]MBK7418107.1 aspartate kinase [Nitrospira sp.]MDQ1291661.1 aspartate kinase [Nitrospirota bacterium]OYT22104.1 MAG: aspartate kinase [Nitrospira sp. UW-LDO-02]MBK7484647.1 aspartate kinase [Nitrospira sp.]MBK9996020.1 aspartate kinase [Nitrospira sp.]
MALIVQKYGGTSVGTVERIHRVAERVERAQKDGHQVVVVLSAMSGETDRLLKLAHEVTGAPDERELDMLLSTGERVTIALLAMELRGRGVNARSFTGRQVGIHTDSAHTKARISRVTADRIKEALSAGVIPVVAGFQGINASSDVTTLGRGGSDLTAVALAAALKADRCIIYTDVDGVYTADPNIVPAARRLDKISYEEMLEMASLGAKVLQSRSVEFAAKYSVPVEVNSSFKEGKGTLVTREDADMEGVMVSGVTGDRNQAKITIVGVPDRPGIAARVFGAVANANIVVDMIIQNVSQASTTDISFTVPKADLRNAVDLVQRLSEEIGARSVAVTESIAKVSLIGVGMRSHSGVAAKMFEVLSREGVNIMMISTSEIKISCVIEEKYLELAMRTLHTAFGLDRVSAPALG